MDSRSCWNRAVDAVSFACVAAVILPVGVYFGPFSRVQLPRFASLCVRVFFFSASAALAVADHNRRQWLRAQTCSLSNQNPLGIRVYVSKALICPVSVVCQRESLMFAFGRDATTAVYELFHADKWV